MGLDSVELVVRLERDFDLDITDEVARDLGTVGDMVSWLHRSVAEKRVLSPSGPPWTEAALLDDLRDIIVDEVGISRDRITRTARFVRDLGVH